VQGGGGGDGGLNWRARCEELLPRAGAGGGGLIHTLADDGISVAAALNVMAERSLSCVIVLDRAARSAVGIFTTRDYAHRVLFQDADATRVRVRDVMTRAPRVAPMERSVLRVARTMIRGGFRHMPVIAGSGAAPAGDAAAAAVLPDRVVGVLSLSDVARAFAAGGEPPAAEAPAPPPAEDSGELRAALL
jgi:CBS domain-containing protein